MAVETITFGESLVGLLSDGGAEAPYAGSTLRMEESLGPVLEVPYLKYDSMKQFEAIASWFASRTPPENLLLKTANSDVSLYGLQWIGHSEKSGHEVSLGRLRPTEIVLARREADLSAPLLIEEVRSHIDGIREWSGFAAIDFEGHADDRGLVKKLTVDVESGSSVTWRQGAATMTLRTDWSSVGSKKHGDPSLGIFDWVVLDSKFEEPASFDDHLVEQRKIVHLLSLVFDGPIHFRKHQARDKTFAYRFGNGKLINYPFVELVSRRTIRDYLEVVPAESELRWPLVSLAQVGVDGLVRWSEKYDEWKRFVLPSVGALSRRGAFVEDMVVSLSMSIESAGHLVGKREGEEDTYRRNNEPTTATYIYRCLNSVAVDWGQRVESLQGLARALGRIYNSIKHFNKGEFPNDDATYLSSRVLRKLVQLVALDVVDPSGGLLEEFRKPLALQQLQNEFANYEMCVLDSGEWRADPKMETRSLPPGVTR